MIQRVQSIYLLLVTVLMSIFLVKSYAEIILESNQVIYFFTFSIQKHIDGKNTELITKTLPLVIMVIFSCVVSMMNIFLFQKRILQMRICVLNSVILIGQLAMIYFYYASTKGDFSSYQSAFKVPVILPVISIILNFMAYRAIHHDETLVNSYNRIR